MVGKGKGGLQRAIRLGEGHAVDVSVVPASKSGLSQHYSIDTSGLPVPDRRLSCDTVALVKTDFVVKLLFAQKDAIGEGYLSVLVVHMAFEAVSNFLHTVTKLESGIEELEKSGKLLRGSLTKITDRPLQSAVVTASMGLTGYSGNDGCFDFYYTSPFAIQRINFGSSLAVEPVVRVQLPTPLLVALLRGLRELEPSLPSIFGEVES